jgi:hypothetical protein
LNKLRFLSCAGEGESGGTRVASTTEYTACEKVQVCTNELKIAESERASIADILFFFLYSSRSLAGFLFISINIWHDDGP